MKSCHGVSGVSVRSPDATRARPRTGSKRRPQPSGKGRRRAFSGQTASDRREPAAQRDGGFRFEKLYTDGPIGLVAQCRGFAAQLRELGRERDGEEIVFRLEPGRKVTVRVLDEAGAPVPIGAWVSDGTAARPEVQHLGPGVSEFQDLPSGTVTFTCRFGGQEFEVRHDTADPVAELRVPVPARIVVVPPPGWPEPEQQSLGAVAARLDEAREPLPIGLERAGEEPVLMLPGRYRVALVRTEWLRDLKRTERTELGPAAEIELTAGELTRVELR